MIKCGEAAHLEGLSEGHEQVCVIHWNPMIQSFDFKFGKDKFSEKIGDNY